MSPTLKTRHQLNVADALAAAGSPTTQLGVRAVLLAMYGYRCAYCGQEPRAALTRLAETRPCHLRLELDHFVPKASGVNVDAIYVAENLVPACVSCNRSKGNHDFYEWQERERSLGKSVPGSWFTSADYGPPPFDPTQCHDLTRSGSGLPQGAAYSVANERAGRQLGHRIPEELYQRLVECSQDTDIPMGRLVERAVVAELVHRGW